MKKQIKQCDVCGHREDIEISHDFIRPNRWSKYGDKDFCSEECYKKYFNM